MKKLFYIPVVDVDYSNTIKCKDLQELHNKVFEDVGLRFKHDLTICPYPKNLALGFKSSSGKVYSITVKNLKSKNSINFSQMSGFDLFSLKGQNDFCRETSDPYYGPLILNKFINNKKRRKENLLALKQEILRTGNYFYKEQTLKEIDNKLKKLN